MSALSSDFLFTMTMALCIADIQQDPLGIQTPDKHKKCQVQYDNDKRQSSTTFKFMQTPQRPHTVNDAR